MEISSKCTRQEEKCILKLPFCSPFPCMAQTCASRYNKVLGKKKRKETGTKVHWISSSWVCLQGNSKNSVKTYGEGKLINLHCIVL